jgi:hypothetical protein
MEATLLTTGAYNEPAESTQTTWWSAQRIISAHSAHIAYGTPSALHVHRSPCTFDVTSVTVHWNIQWHSWTAIYVSLTITIINYKSVVYEGTGNKQLQQPLPNCGAVNCTFQQPAVFYYYSVLTTPVSVCKHRRMVSWRTVLVNKLYICRVQWDGRNISNFVKLGRLLRRLNWSIDCKYQQHRPTEGSNPPNCNHERHHGKFSLLK